MFCVYAQCFIFAYSYFLLYSKLFFTPVRPSSIVWFGYANGDASEAEYYILTIYFSHHYILFTPLYTFHTTIYSILEKDYVRHVFMF